MPYLIYPPSKPSSSSCTDTPDRPTHAIPHADKVDEIILNDLRSWGWRVVKLSDEDPAWQTMLRQFGLRADVDGTSEEVERGERVAKERMPSLLQVWKKENRQKIEAVAMNKRGDDGSNDGEREVNAARGNKRVQMTKLRKERKEPRPNDTDHEVAEADTGILACLWNLIPWNQRNAQDHEVPGWNRNGIMVTRTFDLGSENTLSRPEPSVKKRESIWPIREPFSVHKLQQEELETSERILAIPTVGGESMSIVRPRSTLEECEDFGLENLFRRD
ncbi:hypothetical protein DM02DRAFT_658389 [Periconia macrospinosa]|uniref:Uncharacterized protein n=1 Tax=Periconia macrospinosa TaxID=97972 RepID=A0A2V1DJL0_9PLEO|nr:hypothetical protein DM02DRAFT_658389 [Periconia macrospinosa]